MPYAAKWTPSDVAQQSTLDNYIDRLYAALSNVALYGKITYLAIDRAIVRTLRRLAECQDIVIKPVDKNLGLVVLDRADYISMCMSHLNDSSTYMPVEHFHPGRPLASLRRILCDSGRLYVSNSRGMTRKLTPIANSLLQFASPENSVLCRLSPFYCTPKVHKKTVPVVGRPIVSAVDSVTYAASQLADKFLRPFLRTISTACTSSNSALTQLLQLHVSDEHVLLCADVTALYPSIPTDAGVRAVAQFCRERALVSDDDLNFHIDVLRWVLCNNFCMFNGQTYQQINGTAMGTPVAVSYATIFLATIELPLLSRNSDTLLYLRYIDDICAITTLSAALEFVHAFNSAYPSISLDAVTTNRSGVFLDLHITLQLSGDIQLQLYQKPSNRYQYIPQASAHCPAVFRNWVLEELKRYCLRSTRDEDFLSLTRAFSARLNARGYSPSILAGALTILPARKVLLNDLTLALAASSTSDPAVSPASCKLIGPIITLSLPGRLENPPHWTRLVTIPASIVTHPNYVQSFGGPLQARIHVRHSSNIASYLIRSKFM